MSYYLGKFGRAGAHILSSCKDLYNDVNAAYLTGAVDIVVIRQKDGSLRSTPFHVRFGKLGVLRTGDLKEVEVEINGKLVDLHMKVDESGRGFFSKKKATESISESDSERSHTAIDMEHPLPYSMSEPQLVSSNSHLAQSTPSDQLTLGPLESISSLHRQSSDIVLSGTQTLSRLTVAETGSETRTEVIPESPHEDEPDETTSCFSEGGISFLPNKSAPLSILRESGDGDMNGGMSSSLPVEMEVMSDSGLDQPSLHLENSITPQCALSDTEVEVKDRLSSKLWEWSASRRKRPTSRGVPSKGTHTDLLGDKNGERLKPQPESVDRTGFWGALTGILKRKSSQGNTSAEGGIYLDDLDNDSMDPDELSKFFPSSSVPTEVAGLADQTGSSDLGSSPAISPSQSSCEIMKEENAKLVSFLDSCAFSLCGGLSRGNISKEQFQSAQVSFSAFSADPAAIFSNPNLVVRVNGKYYNWQTAAALVMSSVVYLQAPPNSAQDNLTRKFMPKKAQKSSWYFWGRWSKEIIEDEDLRTASQKVAKSEGSTPIGSPRKWEDPIEGRRQNDSVTNGRERSDSITREREWSDSVTSERVRSDSVTSERVRSDSERTDVLSSDDEQEMLKLPSRPRQRSLRKKKSGFTTSLTSEQLENLPLQSGANTVVFSVTTKYQGTTKAFCTLYLWNYFDKIVVSDIDGTITRSDVAGQVLPLLGKDWTQNGVVELFGSISRNGYRILYLSARAIGQAGYTKEFLRNIKRGTCSLPDGPLFLAPFSLYIAFKKEVIEKKPEEFKIDCLKQIKNLFPEDFSPFHAGFGNKPSDALSYVQVDIPDSRTFTVNHKGHLKHQLSKSFRSNYTDLMSIVDAQFPPLKHADPLEETDAVTSEASIEASNIKEDFNNFNYWKDPTDLDKYLVDIPGMV